MKYIKEDGSLDVERIDSLPLEEYTRVIGKLTQEQYKEYLSRLPINESHEPMQATVVDYTLEEDIERNGIVDADEVINNLLK